MRAALRWRRSCSSSTSSATRARCGDGTVPDGARGQGPARQGELPGVRDRNYRGEGDMSTRPPVNDWATDFDHLDPRWVENPYPIWDELRAEVPDRAHRALPGRLFPLALRGRARGRLRHRAFLLAPHRRARDAAAAHSGAADHLRSARAPAGQAWCCCPPSRPTRSSATSRRTREICDELIDALRRQGRLRCRGRIRAGHSGARDRPHARAARGGRRPLPQLDPGHPRSRHHRPRRADAGDRRDRRNISRPRSTSAARARATISSAISQREASTGSRSTDDHCSARCACS